VVRPVSQKSRQRASLENAASVMAIILVFCLLAALFALFTYNLELRSGIANALRPSERTLMYLQDDPFLSVLGIFSLFVVAFVGTILILFTVWFMAKKCIHLFLARFLISDNCKAEVDEDR
jgi:hypothetical protein